jgi:hypothetical protein
MQEARVLAKQHLSTSSAKLRWEADDVPQPLTEAAVSSFRQRRKLAGLLLQEDSPDPLHQVCRMHGMKISMPLLSSSTLELHMLSSIQLLSCYCKVAKYAGQSICDVLSRT